MDGVPIVTNIVTAVESCRSHGVSCVTVEATQPSTYTLDSQDPRRPVICLSGVRMRIPDAEIGVHDGLLDNVSVIRGEGVIRLALSLAHTTTLSVRSTPGIPARLSLILDREPLRRIMRGRRVLIDPGHGGKDTGGRGPIDLVEKKMTLVVAALLVEQLTGLGSLAAQTRSTDTALSWPERLAMAERGKVEAMVSLHTGWFADPDVAGFRVDWYGDRGQTLARNVHAALRQKLPLPDRGVGKGREAIETGLPMAVVELATISNPVEEGWLRSSTFLKRAAGAIAYGIKDFFAATYPRSVAD